MPRLSRTRAARIAERYAFRPCGARLSPARIVRAGDAIVLFRPAWDEPPVPREVAVLYQDTSLIAVDKPPGLPVHPTARFYKNTLTAVLAERFPDQHIALCHRLDRETSGVVLAARTTDAESRLKAAFARREMHKIYLAVVHGELREDCLVDDAPLALAGGEVSVLMAVRDGGLAARTKVRVLERLVGFTLVQAEPETGRQHQIRVHLAHAGHPIVGDKLYAHGPELFLSSLRGTLSDAQRHTLLLARHALHAAEIAFEHPTSGTTMAVRAPLPADLRAFVARHRLGAPAELAGA
jgi:23S rRNA pseudouridine1911/1915/1917 synthase